MKDITGQRFQRLTAIEPRGCGKNGEALWLCRCDCGGEKVVRGRNLRSGMTGSCGCLMRPNGTHMNEHTQKVEVSARSPRARTYSSWRQMMRRCLDENSDRFPGWGGRGITVCERWRKFKHFLEDMGLRPVGMSIDRINNDGNYEPGNCRWATPSEQARNERRGKIPKKITATSKFRGVRRPRNGSYFAAMIYPDDGSVLIGKFDNEIDAARAYDEAALRQYGKFACLNFPHDSGARQGIGPEGGSRV